MTRNFNQILYLYLLQNIDFDGAAFCSGSATGKTAPYIIQYRITSPEGAETFTEKPDASGRNLFQFSGYADADYRNCERLMEGFKRQICDLKGDIDGNYHRTTTTARDLITDMETGDICIVGTSAYKWSGTTWGAYTGSIGEQYIIWYNSTTGVKQIPGSESTIETYGAMIETTLWWNLKS
jgi:hypothetical protein